MSLRRRILIIIGSTLLAFIILLYLVSQTIMLNGFSELEAKAVQMDVKRAQSAINEELSYLAAITSDWASWDDSYTFVQDGNQKYIEANLADSTFTSLKLNCIIFIDTSCKVVFARGFSLIQGQEAAISQYLLDYIQENNSVVCHAKSDQYINGIVSLPESLMLICSYPIITSNAEGPVKGTLIMGRYLDSAELNRISTRILLPMNLYWLGDERIPEHVQKALLIPYHKSDIVVEAISLSIISGYALINDIAGKPISVLQIEESRTIYAQGMTTIRYFIIAFAIIVVVLAILILYFLERMILSRLSRLKNDVSRIAGGFDLSARVSTTGNDELSNITSSINTMLGNVEQSTNSLRFSEKRYRLLFENAREGLAVIQNGMVIFANKKAGEITGYPLDIPISFVEIVHRDDRETVIQLHKKRLRGEEVPYSYRARIIDSTGQIKWVEVGAVLITWLGDPAVLAFIDNISERKQTEEALEQSEKRFRAASASTSDLIREWSVSIGKLEWFGDIDGMLGYEQGQFPRTLQAWENIIHPEDHDWVMEAIIKHIDTGEPYDVEYRVIQKDKDVRYWLDKGTTIAWDENGFPMRMVGACSDVTQRKLAEEALKDSEEKYRLVVENATEAIFVAQDGMLKFVNQRTSEIIGYSIDELNSRPFTDFIHPDDGQPVLENYIRRLQGEDISSVYPFRIVHESGQIKWVELKVVTIDWEGKAATLNFLSDITERRLAEGAMRDADERYYALYNRSFDAVYIHDFEGNFLDANQVALDLLGYNRDDIPKLNFASLIDDEQMALAFKMLKELKETGTQKEPNAYKLRRKDGSLIYVETTAAVYYKDGKPYAIQGVGRDVTQRRQMEEDLRESETRFRQVAENADEWIWEVDRRGLYTYSSPVVEKILGFKPEELVGKKHFYDLFSPDVKNELKKKAFDTFSRKDNFARLINPNIHKNGTLVILETSGSPILDEQENLMGYRGVDTDITEQKQAEEALKQSEERYRSILDAMEDNYFEVDLGGHFIFVNDSLCRKLEYHIKEIEGMSYRRICADEKAIKHVFQHFSSVYQTGEPVKQISWRTISKKGKLGVVECTAFPLRDRSGKIIGFRGIGRDITDKKRVETEPGKGQRKRVKT